MPRFSIVLPCYNEAETLPTLFARFQEAIGALSDIEVIFVNNGSKDNSAAVMLHEMSLPGRGFTRSVTVEMNQGYGYGILAGLRVAQGEYVGWTHADSQYDPKIVIDGFQALVSAVNPARSFLQGRRSGRGPIDVFFTAGMTALASLMLGTVVRDINAQPKLFPREFLGLMKQPPYDFSLDLYALYLARRHGYQIVTLPVVFARRLHGEAKGGGSLALKWKLTKRTLAFMWQLRRSIRSGRA